jgi:hypothetical protein
VSAIVPKGEILACHVYAPERKYYYARADGTMTWPEMADELITWAAENEGVVLESADAVWSFMQASR